MTNYTFKINNSQRESIYAAICESPYSALIHSQDLEKSLVWEEGVHESEITLNEFQMGAVLKYLQAYIDEESALDNCDWERIIQYQNERAYFVLQSRGHIRIITT